MSLPVTMKEDKAERALWSDIYRKHYKVGKKGMGLMAAVHADNAVRQYRERFPIKKEGK